MKKYIPFIAGILCLCAQVSVAQDGQKKPDGAPMDLSEIVIRGTELLNVRAVSKQVPANTRKLSTKELDSLNTLEKQPAILLDIPEYPKSITPSAVYNGFVRGELGLFLSPEITFGYGGTSGGYAMFGEAKYASSTGHVSNAEFSKIGALFNARYKAPEKYLVFGGSTTETRVDIGRNQYNLFSVASNTPERTTMQYSASIDVNGKSADYPFNAAFRFRQFSLDQVSTDTLRNAMADNGLLGGTIGIGTTWNDATIGAKVDMNFQTIRGQGVSFVEFRGYSDIPGDVVDIKAELGFQAARNSLDVVKGSLLARVDADMVASEFFTFRAKLFSGQKNYSLEQAIAVNPYTNAMATIDFERTNIGISAGMLFHPVESVSVNSEIAYSSLDVLPYYVADTVGSFALQYSAASALRIGVEGAWNLSSNDELLGKVAVVSATLSNDSTAPYITPLFISAQYRRQFNDKLNALLAVSYTGERSTGNAKTPTLDSFINVQLRGEYALSKSLYSYIRIDNLLNQSIFVWKGYQERTAFISVGLNWQL